MRATIIFLAGALLAPFLSGLAVEIAKPWLPEGSRVIGWLLMLYESAAFPWVVAGAGGLLLGMFLDKASAVFDGRHPMTKRGKLRLLAPAVHGVASNCELALSPIYSATINRNMLRAQIYQVGRKLTKLGLSEPHVPEDASPYVMFQNVSSQWRAILPAMEEGDLEAARYLSGLVREGQIRNPTIDRGIG